MKRVFSLIVVLITLSVIGILFIQMQWIKNAIQVKKDQYAQNCQRALEEIKLRSYDLFLDRNRELTGAWILNQQTREFLLDKFTVTFFKPEQMSDLIRQSLRVYGIKQPFEFTVTNYFGYSILSSQNFKDEYRTESFVIKLTTGSSAQQEKLYLYFMQPKNYIIEQMGWMIVASVIFTAIIIWAFALTVRTLFTQKKLSEIKSDFINNMTHELKTPLATISLAVDALTNAKVISNEEKIRYYSGMIKDENKRMNKQVETILQAARIERQEITLNKAVLNAHEIIQKTADNLVLQIQEKHGTLNLHLRANRHKIDADEVHFSNIVFNLLDNAIKYSKDPLRIDVETSNSGQMLQIRFRDNGIGMNKETQSHIFEKFYRAHTGNIHDVKGFGLGLSYVKAMVDAHGGKVRVESTLGKGSTFIVMLPLNR